MGRPSFMWLLSLVLAWHRVASQLCKPGRSMQTRFLYSSLLLGGSLISSLMGSLRLDRGSCLYRDSFHLSIRVAGLRGNCQGELVFWLLMH